jgi:acid phosphatase
VIPPYRHGLFTVWLFVCLSACHPATESITEPEETGPPPTMRFEAIGDWGMGGPVQRDVAARLNAQAVADSAQFTVSVGDNFYGPAVSSADDPRWKELYEDVYRGYTLDHDWYVVLGNHDYSGNIYAQIDYQARNPHWKMPARYYTFVKPLGKKATVQFVCLDTMPFAPEFRDGFGGVSISDTTRQMRWADSVLTASKATWKIVVGHHPVFSVGFHGDTPDLKPRLLPLLKKHKVALYLCGHDHDLQHLSQEGVDFVVTGSGGSVRGVAQPQLAKFHDTSHPGFVGLTIYPDSLRCRYFDTGGNVLYQFKRGGQ